MCDRFKPTGMIGTQKWHCLGLGKGEKTEPCVAVHGRGEDGDIKKEATDL